MLNKEPFQKGLKKSSKSFKEERTTSGLNFFIGVLIIIIVVTLIWGGLTYFGYIPNYFGIGFLCPASEIPSENYPPGKIYYAKPVIYLYPTTSQITEVKLDFKGKIIADDPDYDYSLRGWKVEAFPDGRLINQKDNREYSYLFWEGLPDKPVNYDLSKGFVVKGEDTKEFLENTLSKIGLTPKEYDEFIVYWYPRMKDNKLNLIHFAGKEYTDIAHLTINPKPDSILRVFMVYKPINNQINIQPQAFPKFERKGFTVIEWGGTELQ